MDVILLEKVPNLGSLGDKVSVRPGYGRNFLIPKGKAVAATAAKLAEFEQRRAELEKKASEELAAAQARAEAVARLNVSIAQKAGEEGKLYGSVGTKDIAEAVTAAGVPVERHEVRLPHGPIRLAGDYEITLHLHSDVNATLNLKVIGE
ncbi:MULTISPECIES: 50S ribosomal protein L9 [Methylococcus]|jgi:large subunit ribosomal protein L9|uniref:Large ribosomal subunit protein bL9 n=1 Tax=Methylococcus capsulatus (strain ATCC 33009 / NCIMB 11132 / Bath) TaxID=243233 RepID=RL9_METCA|nr:50S ribosomal protein L9 [Methylococcus capsulatus]Q606I1.1 RecName: Full=Large ribosomal subunit protein bL9; AltName: Full=50S ribosomal protein L9 [Methylococcus capsulatus str. Bath]AAU91713.1 ribosomal protein L9 [Methylococcus capsulatus str. Bath]QXP87343.1 50S ribosomal protein L9 [Methylococcus capsulatus]QXP91302.1 50S ribosomal protein L9 [Methylococcus capsulatus]QXP92916.1 50S ribosomal protein L9 [Methylococcus capsulatus]UQN12344.1 50S ribosomal protein L9 [Methylococcus cap